jgi:hypothetical protein
MRYRSLMRHRGLMHIRDLVCRSRMGGYRRLRGMTRPEAAVPTEPETTITATVASAGKTMAATSAAVPTALAATAGVPAASAAAAVPTTSAATRTPSTSSSSTGGGSGGRAGDRGNSKSNNGDENREIRFHDALGSLAMTVLQIVHPDRSQIPVGRMKNCQEPWAHHDMVAHHLTGRYCRTSCGYKDSPTSRSYWRRS